MEVFRKIVAVVTALAVAVCFVGLGFLACTLPPVTHGLSSVFAQDELSPFDRNQLVKVADATRDYSFGSHDELALYQVIYEVNDEYRQAVTENGGLVPAAFPALNAVRDAGNIEQYRAAFENASELYCYTPSTVSHLDDCHAIAAAAYPVLIACAIIGAAGLFFTGTTGGKRRLGTTVLGAGLAVLVGFVVVGAWAAIDFTGFFAAFHQLFFAQQGNWTFPYDSLLICSLPQPFWMGMGIVFLLVAVLVCVASILVGQRLRK